MANISIPTSSGTGAVINTGNILAYSSTRSGLPGLSLISSGFLSGINSDWVSDCFRAWFLVVGAILNKTMVINK